MLSWTHLNTFEVLALLAMAGCTSAVQRVPEHPVQSVHQPATAFLQHLMRPWPAGSTEFALAVSNEKSQHVSTYDNALFALYLMRIGQRPQAARILGALARLQLDDGSLPFSFVWPAPDSGGVYVRNGATAWVGYAATEYLDADSGGPSRDVIVKLAHGVANYLLQHQIDAAGDLRDGLVLGGSGSYRLDLEGGEVREVFVPGDVLWASTEHNIDAFFFLRDFGRITADARFQVAAERIRKSLLERGWTSVDGQMARGFEKTSIDRAYALDCASWGALFLRAAGDDKRAETSLAAAEWRYHANEPRTRSTGHRPYAHANILANPELREHYRAQLAATNWDELAAVWPEGSAGVALAALRMGRRDRAREILEQLETLRQPNGGMPYFTIEVPFEFDTQPSLASTVWVELVRYELEHSPTQETLWRRR
jgi:hypothetical protein